MGTSRCCLREVIIVQRERLKTIINFMNNVGPCGAILRRLKSTARPLLTSFKHLVHGAPLEPQVTEANQLASGAQLRTKATAGAVQC